MHVMYTYYFGAVYMHTYYIIILYSVENVYDMHIGCKFIVRQIYVSCIFHELVIVNFSMQLYA